VLAIATHDDGSTGGKATATTTVPPAAPGTLRAHVAAGNLTLDGAVPKDDEKRDIEKAASERFGKDNVVSRLQVLATAESAGWLAKAMESLPRRGSGFGTIDVEFSKAGLSVKGQVPTASAGTELLAAIEKAADRKAGDELEIVGEGAGGRLQKNITDALRGRPITFETGSAAITKSGQTVLGALVAQLKWAGAARVQIGGYTDSVGDAKANLRLSKARANSVKVWLVKKGKVPAARLIVRGYGETKPIAPNSTEAGRKKNRRIEFTVLGG
jgi:OOP family OmpA-OmpF porin